jgi:hypothetical protein
LLEVWRVLLDFDITRVCRFSGGLLFFCAELLRRVGSRALHVLLFGDGVTVEYRTVEIAATYAERIEIPGSLASRSLANTRRSNLSY